MPVINPATSFLQRSLDDVLIEDCLKPATPSAVDLQSVDGYIEKISQDLDRSMVLSREFKGHVVGALQKVAELAFQAGRESVCREVHDP